MASRVDETVVVLGHKAAEIAPKMNSAPVKIMINARYQDGMSTSIITGLMEDVQEVRVDSPGVTMDIDPQEEYDSIQ